MISSYVTSSKTDIPFLMDSAVAKSTRQCFAIASVNASPALGIMPYAVIAPSFVIQISDVPAPTSTSAIFSNRNFSGMATMDAAIGSRVKLDTSSPAISTARYKPSITSSGRKVAIKSNAIRCPF